MGRKRKILTRKKENLEENKNNVFKEVDKNVKVTNLGVFGNRKKNNSQ